MTASVETGLGPMLNRLLGMKVTHTSSPHFPGAWDGDYLFCKCWGQLRMSVPRKPIIDNYLCTQFVCILIRWLTM